VLLHYRSGGFAGFWMRLFLFMFCFFGLGMASLDVFLIRDVLRFRAGAAMTAGEVIGFRSSRGSKGGTMYAPIVRFAVPLAEGGSGQSFEITGSVSSSNPGFDEGDKVDVMFHPDRPGEGRIQSFMEQWFGPLIVGLFALIFNGIWLGFAAYLIRQRRMHAWLEQHGMPVQADLVEVRRNTSLKVNGRSPWVIDAQWQHPLTGTVHSFSSENLWFDPSDYVKGRAKLDVRVDADDPRRHRIDLSFLPKAA